VSPAEPEPTPGPELMEIDRLVHEPSRLLVVASLYVIEKADFVFLSRQTGLTGGNLSSHMSKLVDAGYVGVEKLFVRNRPQTLYWLTEDGRRAFREYRRSMSEFFGAMPE